MLVLADKKEHKEQNTGTEKKRMRPVAFPGEQTNRQGADCRKHAGDRGSGIQNQSGFSDHTPCGKTKADALHKKTCGGDRFGTALASAAGSSETEDQQPCRHPDTALGAMEGYGMDVYQTVKNTELKYTNGQNTVTYFGIILFTE